MVFVALAALCLLSSSSVSRAQDVMCMANRCPPQMVHTMLDPVGVGVAVLWQTFARTQGNSTVWLGTTSGNYTLVIDSQREQSITQSEAGYVCSCHANMICRRCFDETRKKLFFFFFFFSQQSFAATTFCLIIWLTCLTCRR